MEEATVTLEEDKQRQEDSKFVRAALMTPLRSSASQTDGVVRGIRSTLSNREPELLEPSLTDRKQTNRPRSNRELPTKRCSNNFQILLPPLAQICKWSRPLLTGTALQTEFDVTSRKQTTEKFLTGARTHIRTLRFPPFSIAETA